MSLPAGHFAAHYQRWFAATLIPLTAATAFAAPAHADDQAFLNDLRASGMPVMYEPYYVGLGYKICAQIMAGMSTADAASQLGIEGQISGSPDRLCRTTRPVPENPVPARLWIIETYRPDATAMCRIRRSRRRANRSSSATLSPRRG
jgi:Protein of unknown function (DUF732)